MRISTMQKRFSKDMQDTYGDSWAKSRYFDEDCKRYAKFFSSISSVHYVPIYNALVRCPKELKLMGILDG